MVCSFSGSVQLVDLICSVVTKNIITEVEARELFRMSGVPLLKLQRADHEHTI